MYKWVEGFCSLGNRGAVGGKVKHLTIRIHVAVCLFSNRSQMASKCGENKKIEALGNYATDVLTTF